MGNQISLTGVDKFLIENWHEVSSLKTAIDDVKKRYEAIFHEIVGEAMTRWPILDAPYVYVHTASDGGALALGIKSWGSEDEYPSGLYFGNLSLEKLLSLERPRCWVDVYLAKGVGTEETNSGLVSELREQLRQLLSQECYETVSSGGYKYDLIWWDLLPDADLRAALKKADIRVFKEIILNQVSVFIHLVPTISKFLVENMPSMG